jgi:hypothetical protein
MQGLRSRGWAVLLVLFCLGGFGVLSASPASAVSSVLGLCDPEAPVPDSPGTGMPGFFMDAGTLRTPKVSSPADPYHLYNDSGFSGLSSNTYDLGCSTNPQNWGNTISAMSDTGLGNKAVSVGQSATALADAADTRAWNPEWIVTVLGNFMDKVMDVVVLRVLAPFFVAGLLLASILMINKSRSGDVAAVAGGVAWAVFVVIVVGILVTGPLRVATTAQSVGGAGVSVLNADVDGQPGRAATEQIMYSVHYQGWLRRTFGSSNSETAKEYGPRLLAASRITRAEYDATDPGRTGPDGKRLSADQREQVLKTRKELLEAKAKEYEKIAAIIKDQDPGAYKYLQGLGGTNTGVGLVEGSFGVVASAFRIAVDLLLILGVVVLVMLGAAWVIGAPFLVTSWGEAMGRGLLNGTARAVALVLVTALGSWLFGLWTQVSLTPGIAAWWSMLLLILGTVVFWTMIRPDRRALNLITMGRMHGHSGTLRRLALLAGGGYLLNRVNDVATATRDRARQEVEATRNDFRGDPENAAAARAYRLGHVDGPNPYEMAERPSEDVDPYVLTGTERVAPTTPVRPPGSVPIYTPPQYDVERPPYGTPPPPPAGASGDEDVYQAPVRVADNEAWWRR